METSEEPNNTELHFEIADDQLIFISVKYNGGFVDGLMDAGTVFKFLLVKEVETKSMVDCSKFEYSLANSSIGNQIELKNADESTIFECSVNAGSFSNVDDIKTTTVKPGEGFYWAYTEDTNEVSRIFVEVILKKDSNIIGYAIIEIYSYSGPYTYRAEILKSVLLPKVGGNYQVVTKEQVKTFIEQEKV